jgi:hypothetical protein
LALSTLEDHLGAADLGRLHRPGVYYDFTRYRPRRSSGGGDLKVPNAALRYALRPGASDLVFLHALEPHLRGEEFVESVLAVAERRGVRRYCLVGATYGRNPHTRPLGMSGRTSEESVREYFKKTGVKISTHDGPTTIMVMATEQAQERGMQMMHLVVQLPPYIRVEEDFRGQEALLRMLNDLYGLGLDMDPLVERGEEQYKELGRRVRGNPQMRELIRRLEWDYDTQLVSGSREELEFPSDIEGFLRELEGEGDPQ